MSALPSCKYVYHSVCRGQNAKSDPPGLELQKIVSQNVNAENLTQILCKSNKCSEPTLQPSSKNFS